MTGPARRVPAHRRGRPQPRAWGRHRSAWLLAALGSLGCASAPPVTPEAFEAEERRLLGPFDDEQIIVASECELTMSANFYDELTRRVNSMIHDTIRTEEDGGTTVYRFRTTVPGAGPMVFLLGNTKLVVEQQMVLRILGGRHAMTLDASARTVTLNRGGETVQMAEIEIRDGAFRRAGS